MNDAIALALCTYPTKFPSKTRVRVASDGRPCHHTRHLCTCCLMIPVANVPYSIMNMHPSLQTQRRRCKRAELPQTASRLEQKHSSIINQASNGHAWNCHMLKLEYSCNLSTKLLHIIFPARHPIKSHVTRRRSKKQTYKARKERRAKTPASD